MYKSIHKQTQVLQKYAALLIGEKSVEQEWYDVSIYRLFQHLDLKIGFRIGFTNLQNINKDKIPVRVRPLFN
jgi:hypothetical protein